jgi:hypothetical protein
MELNYLGNSNPELQFVLLTDYVDALTEETADDKILLNYAKKELDRLNNQYSTSGDSPFVLLHRQRRWNDDAGLWMGWERKRGKLLEFNDLLRGSDDTDYATEYGVLRKPEDIRYVITLDADTRLPANSAAKLVGTLAHPLNRPVINGQTGEIDDGYSIVQPRLETNPTTSTVSPFARIFSGDVTLDLYTHAVSRQRAWSHTGQSGTQSRSARRALWAGRAGFGHRHARRLSDEFAGLSESHAPLDSRRLAITAVAIQSHARRFGTPIQAGISWSMETLR